MNGDPADPGHFEWHTILHDPEYRLVSILTDGIMVEHRDDDWYVMGVNDETVWFEKLPTRGDAIEVVRGIVEAWA